MLLDKINLGENLKNTIMISQTTIIIGLLSKNIVEFVYDKFLDFQGKRRLTFEEKCKQKDEEIRKLEEECSRNLQDKLDIIAETISLKKVINNKDDQIDKLNKEFNKLNNKLNNEFNKLNKSPKQTYHISKFNDIFKNETLNKNDVNLYVKSCIKSFSKGTKIVIPSSLIDYVNENRLYGCSDCFTDEESSNEDRYIKLYEKLSIEDVDLEFEFLRYKIKIENKFIEHLRIHMIREYSQIKPMLLKFLKEDKNTKKTLNLIFHPDKVNNFTLKNRCIEIFKELQNA